jgi:hypothetical protein
MLLTMLMLLMVVAFAVAVDADAVNDCLGEALGIAAVSASPSERTSNCKKNRLRYKVHLRADALLLSQEDFVARRLVSSRNSG